MNVFMWFLLSVGLLLGSGFFTGQASNVIGHAPALIEAAPAGTVRHVTSSATGTGPCDQWANACPLLKALELAQAGDNIWVAAGTYKPSSTANREASFSLKNGVSLYGGFPAAGGDWPQRDWQVNLTVLSGDIGAELLDSYHVVKGIDIIQTATLDGFIIREGQRRRIWLRRWRIGEGRGTVPVSERCHRPQCDLRGKLRHRRRRAVQRWRAAAAYQRCLFPEYRIL